VLQHLSLELGHGFGSKASVDEDAAFSLEAWPLLLIPELQLKININNKHPN
jgi:hypothetical protein